MDAGLQKVTTDDSPLPHAGRIQISLPTAFALPWLVLAAMMAWLAPNVATAVPARSGWTTFTQSDGTEITVRLCGDERLKYYATADGAPLVRLGGGDFCYADTRGLSLRSTGVTAHEMALRTADEQALTSTVAAAERLRMATARAQAAARALQRQTLATREAVTEQRLGLVIMVDFPDRSFAYDDAHNQWDAILNETGFAMNGANGSVADYFRDQSGGAFDITFDLLGPVTASMPRYYYGTNHPLGYDIDLNMDKLVVEACEGVRVQVDFADYDWDGDGRVEQVFILYAGCGEAVVGANDSLIWPHEYALSGYDDYPGGYEIDGYIIDTYACGCELQGLESSSNTELSGLGTFCHEFAHCLGLPDLYTYSGTDMLGSWDLLSDGCYNADGWYPPEFTAYEKYFCGWLTPIELNEPATIDSLLPTARGGAAYMVRNDAANASADEYYLIENRQKTGWDAYAPGSGIIVTHVDYSWLKWTYNIVNDEAGHPGVAIIPANNGFTPGANVGYPYATNDSLTDNSRPAARVYNTTQSGTLRMGKPITAMNVADGMASFRFMGGKSTDDEGTQTDIRACAASAAKGQPAIIIDASGRQVASVETYSGIPDRLPKGIYIVKTNDGTTLKVAKQ